MDCLEENIPNVWEPGLLFMQDNASIYNACAVRKWLEDVGIDLLKLPPYSPDLKPIEHLWYRLKQKVYEVRPDIEKVREDVHRVRDALWDVLERAWHLIEEDSLGDLVESMPRRVAAAIRAGGLVYQGSD